MTVALCDAEALIGALGGRRISELSDLQLSGCIAQFRQERLALAGTVNILANALHSVFSVPSGSAGSNSRDPLASSAATRASLRAACLGERGDPSLRPGGTHPPKSLPSAPCT